LALGEKCRFGGAQSAETALAVAPVKALFDEVHATTPISFAYVPAAVVERNRGWTNRK
jgi:hypothetical protein